MPKALALLLLALSTAALAAASHPIVKQQSTTTVQTSATTQTTEQASTKTGTPLNRYGAVDVNAHVPLSSQVPPTPVNFKAPKLEALAQLFNNELPTPPQLNAHSYILISAKNGQVLAEHLANQRVAPASITKLMLLYLVEKGLAKGVLNLDQMVKVPTVAWATGGSRMFLKPNQSVSIHDLVYGTIVESGNDAAVALATTLAGSQSTAVDMMNRTAKQLDMTNTHFSDVMGLPAPNHYSSARDLAILGQAIINNYPQFYTWYKKKRFGFNGVSQPNFNRLLFTYPYADGLKTGSTQEAGFSLVSSAKMPNRNMRLIAVVMGTPSSNASASASEKLLKYGFRFFATDQLYGQDQSIQNARIYMGQEKTIPVGTERATYITYPRSEAKSLHANLKLNSPLKAPITKGQMLGELQVKIGDTIINQTPVFALKSVKEGNFWQRIADRLALTFGSGHSKKA